MSRESVYRATLEKWGEDAQYDQAIEECAELITALLHYRRDKTDRQAIIAELADVTLMVGQLTWMFGPDEVDRAVTEKLAKLDRLLSDAE